MKKQILKIKSLLVLALLIFGAMYNTACSVPVVATYNYGDVEPNTIVLKGNNFTYLGTYSGTVVTTTSKVRISNDKGIIYAAKNKMLQNAKNDGVTILGRRAIANVSLDYSKTRRKISLTYCADIIEFKK